jgi:arylsulfatase A-like enzyme
MLPTLLAIAGDTEVTDKLLKGYKIGDMTYKVHLDGYNLVPHLTGQTAKSPRESFFYINDDQQLTGLRYDNWNVFMEQRAEGTTHEQYRRRLLEILSVAASKSSFEFFASCPTEPKA